jgi:hypothetical protein
MDKNDLEDKEQSGQTKEDDLDIAQLFILIGKGFTGIINFIAHLLKTIFGWFLLFLIFIRGNLKKMMLAALIGGSLGAVYQYALKEVQYESSMTVEPNFGSTVQLYKNIDYYLSLVKQDDFESLASSLNISQEEAASISWIEIEPYSNENQVLLSFKDFIAELDSNAVKQVDYKIFSKEQPIESFKYHVINITSKDKYVFTKLASPIINSISSNSYYNKVKATANKNLILKKSALESSMIELDSLRELYKKVLLTESANENSGTNIFMSETGSVTKEVDVFDKYLVMNEELIKVNEKLTTENEVVNVVSSFNAIGMKVKTWYKNFAVIGFFAGLTLMFLLISIRKLDQQLVNYKNQH